MNTYERIRVLYVEDNVDSFDMLQMMLSTDDIKLEPAASIAEALKRAGEERFDLYLLDTGLPDGSGLSLCRTLRAVDPTVPVLFYSGDAQPAAIKLGMAAGANAYLSKPHSEKLAETIVQLVSSSRAKASGLASLPVLNEIHSGASYA